MIEVDRLVRALRKVDEWIVQDQPDAAEELLAGPVEEGRRKYAEALAMAYEEDEQ